MTYPSFRNVVGLVHSMYFGLFCECGHSKEFMHFGLDTSYKLQVIFAIVTKKGNNRPKSVKFFIEFMHI